VTEWVERKVSDRVGRAEGRWFDPGRVKSITKTFTPVASLVSFHPLKASAGPVNPV